MKPVHPQVLVTWVIVVESIHWGVGPWLDMSVLIFLDLFNNLMVFLLVVDDVFHDSETPMITALISRFTGLILFFEGTHKGRASQKTCKTIVQIESIVRGVRRWLVWLGIHRRSSYEPLPCNCNIVVTPSISRFVSLIQSLKVPHEGRVLQK